jgi:mannose-6-phosphate isomerase-like protein (cupin superfamily)
MEPIKRKTIQIKDGVVDVVEKPILVNNKEQGKYIEYKGEKNGSNFRGKQIDYADKHNHIQLHKEIFTSSNIPKKISTTEEPQELDDEYFKNEYMKYKQKYLELKEKMEHKPEDILHINIEKETLENVEYRKILKTTQYMQLVLMSLEPNAEIPLESHSGNQFFRIEQGNVLIKIGDKEHTLVNGDCMIIPSNTEHYVKNIGLDIVKLYTIYSPPQH